MFFWPTFLFDSFPVQTCSVEKVLLLDQPRCKDVHFPVTVTDFHNHEKPIANAKVELIQLYTLAGESNKKLDTKYTDDEVGVNSRTS